MAALGTIKAQLLVQVGDSKTAVAIGSFELEVVASPELNKTGAGDATVGVNTTALAQALRDAADTIDERGLAATKG